MNAIIELKEFQDGTDGDARYILAETPESRRLLSHLLNGAGACFPKEDMPNIEELAKAHQWRLSIRYLQSQ